MKDLPKLVITDIDGVWTDGGMYYDNKGNELKKFSTSDGGGVIFLKLMKIPIAIITGENTEIMRRRAEKLGIEKLYMGVKDKVSIAKAICNDMNIALEDVAFIGDDINDIKLLKIVGLSATPDNSPKYIKDIVDVVINVKGDFRAFVEHILETSNKMNEVLKLYLKE